MGPLSEKPASQRSGPPDAWGARRTGPARHLPLNGTHNFRDAGGYRTSGGGSVRWRTLFRSDSLHSLDDEAQRRVASLGIRTVVDLRHDHETEEFPNVFAASQEIRYWNLPLAPSNGVKRWAETLEELNLFWLDNCQGAIGNIVTRLGKPNAFPSVLHCAIGKDRTGLMVALLLKLAGVPNETVAEDYALSARYLSPAATADLRRRFLDNGGHEARLGVMLECRAEVMEGALKHVDSAYGGIEGYMATAGVRDTTICAIQSALLE